MAQLNLNLENVETQQSFEPLPAGDYMARIIDSEIKESQSGTSYIKFTWEVMDEKFRGRQVFDNISISNPRGKRYDAGKSPAEIGQRKLKTIATCGKHPNPNFLQDTAELHNLPMIIKLKVRQDNQYGPQNDVKGFKALSATGGGVPAPHQQAPPPPQQQQPPVQENVPGWLQNAA